MTILVLLNLADLIGYDKFMVLIEKEKKNQPNLAEIWPGVYPCLSP